MCTERRAPACSLPRPVHSLVRADTICPTRPTNLPLFSLPSHRAFPPPLRQTHAHSFSLLSRACLRGRARISWGPDRLALCFPSPQRIGKFRMSAKRSHRRKTGGRFGGFLSADSVRLLGDQEGRGEGQRPPEGGRGDARPETCRGDPVPLSARVREGGGRVLRRRGEGKTTAAPSPPARRAPDACAARSEDVVVDTDAGSVCACALRSSPQENNRAFSWLRLAPPPSHLLLLSRNLNQLLNTASYQTRRIGGAPAPDFSFPFARARYDFMGRALCTCISPALLSIQFLFSCLSSSFFLLSSSVVCRLSSVSGSRQIPPEI